MINRLRFRYDKNDGRLYKRKQKILKKLLIAILFLIDKFILSWLCTEKKPKISPSLKKLLLKIYLEDINNLELLLNRDLSIWKTI